MNLSNSDSFSSALASIGWTSQFQAAFEAVQPEGSIRSVVPGRVLEEHRSSYTVWTEAGVLSATISGKMRYQATARGEFPAVGDFVVLSPRLAEGSGTIHAVLPRFSQFIRKSAGFTTDEQIVAANVNTVFLVMALNHDFNVRRLERYLTMAWESGASPVVVLTKADLCEDVAAREREVFTVAPGVPIHAVSVVTDIAIDTLEPYIRPGQSVAMLGSSGVGKSSLLNRLAQQDLQKVQDVRHGDDRGRHTTTSRTLFQLPAGGLVIDTPGMRELQLLDAEGASAGLAETFADIEALAEGCRFRDCKHRNEPGCRVQEAIQTGDLDAERFASYEKLQRELAFIARKEDERAQLAERAKWKQLTVQQRKRGHRR